MEVGTEIRIVRLDDPDYPPQLREIADPPAQLYVRGSLNWQQELIAMVGSRKPTDYGIRVTSQLAQALVGKCIIVSGLAYGVDSVAHQTVVENGGITVAVLGTGVDSDSIYPPINRGLADEIVRNGGAVISEYPPGTSPEKFHFPQRNRIIAGLSRKIVVVEAAEGSGSLITAKLALDYDREVLAVPGPITSPNSWGPNQLIAEGAKPVLTPNDVVEMKVEEASGNLTELEQIVYNTLRSGTKTVNEISELTNLTASEINIIITFLEMRGVVMNTGAGRFIIK